MKARTQYNDFEGTIAAKVISDGIYRDSFNSLLESKFSNFESSKYRCEGIAFSLGKENTNILAEFICLEISSNQYFRFLTDDNFSLSDLFDFLAYANIVIGKNVDRIDENKLKEEPKRLTKRANNEPIHPNYQ